MSEEFRDLERNSIVGTDSRGNQLTHYVLAERLMQTEYHSIVRDMMESPTSETLIHMLDAGFRGFHQMSGGELWSEWRERESAWFALLDNDAFAWSVFDEDPESDSVKNSS